MDKSPSRKRQKLSSSIETVPISSDEDTDDDSPVQHIPLIQIEDISSDDEKPAKPPQLLKQLHSDSRTSSPGLSSGVSSPMKMLAQANLFDNLVNSGLSLRSPSLVMNASQNEPNVSGIKVEPSLQNIKIEPKIEVSSADSQSNIVSTTTMLSPFSKETRPSTMGSPKYMVQEVSSTVVTHKRFLLTGLNTCKQEIKEKIKIMIKQLGGEYIDSPNFVERCTHIVLGKPNTGEKYMGGLMTGKWLLKTEYVEDSYAEGCWLEEEGYEWTKDSVDKISQSSGSQHTDPELAKLASSARRCRLRYNAEGPFHGWTASILSNHPRRQECYERLFKSGGGRVINITDYRKRHNELTFILVDSPEQTHIPLKNPSVPLLRIKYIHNVVLEERKPEMCGYKVKREETKDQLPAVRWQCTFSTVRKQINLTSKKCPIKVIEFIEGVMCSEDWRGILLPLTSNQAPPPSMLRGVVRRSFLPQTEFAPLRQVVSDLHIVSWFIPPSHPNRDYYISLMEVQERIKNDQRPHNADKFITLLEDAVKDDSERTYPQSPRYLTFWLQLLEKDFYNWERNPQIKPLVERIMWSWHNPKVVFRCLLTCYHKVMTAEIPNERLMMAMNSLIIIYFTTNEMKRRVNKESYKVGSTMDKIAERVHEVVVATLKLRDIRRVHVLIHMLSFSPTLLIAVFNKVLVSLNQDYVPDHYRVLSERPPGWEKFYNFYLFVRYDGSSLTPPPDLTYTTEIYLILLSTMFRALLTEHAAPPAELYNPHDKTADLENALINETDYSLSPSSRLMIRLLFRAVR